MKSGFEASKEEGPARGRRAASESGKRARKHPVAFGPGEGKVRGCVEAGAQEERGCKWSWRETSIWGEHVWREDSAWSDVGRPGVVGETQKEGAAVAPFFQQVGEAEGKLKSQTPWHP